MKTAQHVQVPTATVSPNGDDSAEQVSLPGPVDHFDRMGDSLRVQLRAIADSYTAELLLRGYTVSAVSSHTSATRLFLDYCEGRRQWK